MKLTRKILQPYVERKLVHEIIHPTEKYYMYKYSRDCTFERKWDWVTLQCRGIILDCDDNIIARPFDKFFNYEEHESPMLPAIPKSNDYDIYKKLDGSLGISYIGTDNKIYITTAGSFISDQGARATHILNTKYKDCIDKMLTTYCNFTYLFEIIYPDDLHVVNYYGKEDIVLIGIRNKLSGIFLDLHINTPATLNFNVVEKFETEERGFAALQALNTRNEEGFVLCYRDGFRVKVKFADYILLHRNKALLSEKSILESLVAGVDMLPMLPEEDRKWAENVIAKFKLEYKTIKLAVELAVNELLRDFGNVNDEKTFKRLCAQKIFNDEGFKKYRKYSAIVFQALDAKDYSKLILKYIK